MLIGEQVVLRPVQREDLDRLWELLASDLEIQTLVSARPPMPRSRAHLVQQFERNLQQDPPPPRFVVEAEGTVVGRCELHSLDHYSRHCEIGVALGRDYWGRGYGRDASGVLVRYAFNHLNMHKVVLEALAHDPRAVGAYRKAGFVDEGTLREHTWHDGAYRDVLAMGMLRADAEAAGWL